MESRLLSCHMLGGDWNGRQMWHLLPHLHQHPPRDLPGQLLPPFSVINSKEGTVLPGNLHPDSLLLLVLLHLNLIYSTAGNVSAWAARGVSSSLLQMTVWAGVTEKTATGSYGTSCWPFATRDPNNNCRQRFLTAWHTAAPITRSLCA